MRTTATSSTLSTGTSSLCLRRWLRRLLVLAAALLAGSLVSGTPRPLWAQSRWFPAAQPEQRRVQVRHPSQLPRVPIPRVPAPGTVNEFQQEGETVTMSLDAVIQVALANSEVVRVLGGVTANSSGRTVYDAAITNTTIDHQRARFDPNLRVDNSWNRRESANAVLDPLDPDRALLLGGRGDDHNLSLGLTKLTGTGGQFGFGVNANSLRQGPGRVPLNPENRTSVDLSLTQPLLRGSGVAVNLAPIVLARIDTERSFFQLKDSVQELARGAAEAYWNLVFARTDLWAREQQVEQAEFAYELTAAQLRTGTANRGDVAQTKVALANFRATLISARADVLQREAALQNLLGLPPQQQRRLIPTTFPEKESLEVQWDQLLGLAEQMRPDLIELKLILEADQQLLLQANNQSLPDLNAVALYRWNGLEGEMPIGDRLGARGTRSNDWTLGVEFSVPLGLRQGRAEVRQRELLLARDRANLQQGLHNALHQLALSVRNLALFHAQYVAFRETREAARENLEQQLGLYRNGLTQYINVLLAISDWGNAISSEARSLTQYNVELATLERLSGTILETHGVRFFEERFGALGPLGPLANLRCYPYRNRPTANQPRYAPRTGEEPAETFFELQNPVDQRRSTRRGPKLPPLEPVEPPESLPSPK